MQMGLCGGIISATFLFSFPIFYLFYLFYMTYFLPKVTSILLFIFPLDICKLTISPTFFV